MRHRPRHCPRLLGHLMGLAAARSMSPAHIHTDMLARLLKAAQAHLFPLGCGVRKPIGSLVGPLTADGERGETDAEPEPQTRVLVANCGWCA